MISEKEKAKKLKEKEKAKKLREKEKEKAKKLREKEKAKKLREKEKAKKLREKENAKKLKDKTRKSVKSGKVSGGEEPVSPEFVIENSIKENLRTNIGNIDLFFTDNITSILQIIDSLKTHIRTPLFKQATLEQQNNSVRFSNTIIPPIEHIPLITQDILKNVVFNVDLLKDMLKMSIIYNQNSQFQDYYSEIPKEFNNKEGVYPDYAINERIHYLSFKAVSHIVGDAININTIKTTYLGNLEKFKNEAGIKLNSMCWNFIYVCMERDIILQKIANPIAGRVSLFSLKQLAEQFMKGTKGKKTAQIYPEGVGVGEGVDEDLKV
jgi:hypothetical protein